MRYRCNPLSHRARQVFIADLHAAAVSSSTLHCYSGSTARKDRLAAPVLQMTALRTFCCLRLGTRPKPRPPLSLCMSPSRRPCSGFQRRSASLLLPCTVFRQTLAPRCVMAGPCADTFGLAPGAAAGKQQQRMPALSNRTQPLQLARLRCAADPAVPGQRVLLRVDVLMHICASAGRWCRALLYNTSFQSTEATMHPQAGQLAALRSTAAQASSCLYEFTLNTRTGQASQRRVSSAQIDFPQARKAQQKLAAYSLLRRPSQICRHRWVEAYADPPHMCKLLLLTQLIRHRSRRTGLAAAPGMCMPQRPVAHYPQPSSSSTCRSASRATTTPSSSQASVIDGVRFSQKQLLSTPIGCWAGAPAASVGAAQAAQHSCQSVNPIPGVS